MNGFRAAIPERCKELAGCLTFKIVIPHNLIPILDELYQNRMLEDRTKSSSKYYTVRSIGGLLNQSSEKAVQLELSGGAR